MEKTNLVCPLIFNEIRDFNYFFFLYTNEPNQKDLYHPFASDVWTQQLWELGPSCPDPRHLCLLFPCGPVS